MALTTRTLIAALTALAILGLAATSADATHSRGKCKARGDTIARNDVGRVYEVERDAYTMRLYGCLWSRDEPVLLESALDDGYATAESYDHVILRGRFVAWISRHQDVTCKAACPEGYDRSTEYVNVVDLRRRAADTVTSDPLFGSLRLNSGGALAWLTSAGDGNRAVQAWDRDGHRQLDSGPIRRFRLRGPTLSWLNGEAAKSETLSGAPRASR